MFHNLLDGGDELFAYPTELKLKSMLAAEALTEDDYQSLVILPQNAGEAQDNGPAAEWTVESYSKHNRPNVIARALFDRGGYDAHWDRTSKVQHPLASLIRKDVLSVQSNSNQKHKHPRMWCVKEVGGHTHRIAAAWRKLFPGARIIMIRRSPLKVIRSVLNDRRRIGVRPTWTNLIKQIFDAVAVDRAIATYEKQPEVLAVRYEDLVRSPQTEMKRVCDFLAIGCEPILHRPTLFGMETVVKTSSKPSQSIFADTSAWHQGLTAREKCMIFLFYPIAMITSGAICLLR